MIRLTEKQKDLIQHALKREVPGYINEALCAIEKGTKKVEVSKTKLVIEDYGIIQLADCPFNQRAAYLIKEFGVDFGILYLGALMGKEEYKTAQRVVEGEK